MSRAKRVFSCIKVAFVSVVGLLSGCEQSSGSLQFVVSAEETIRAGLDPASGAADQEEAIQDGWTIRYERFLVAIGNFRVSPELSEESVGSERDPRIHLVDLVQVPESGLDLYRIDEIAARRYLGVSYDTPIAPADALANAATGVSAADVELMSSQGWSIWISGQASKGNKTLRFAWGLPAPTAYSECKAEEGDFGLVVPEGGAGLLQASLHGDHFWFNSFPGGSEGEVQRYADWLELADRDGNGEVTVAELQASPAAELFPSDRYSLSAPSDLGVLRTAYDFVVIQASTLGHLQGEGECVFSRL